jgi:hypothetical protein
MPDHNPPDRSVYPATEPDWTLTDLLGQLAELAHQMAYRCELAAASMDAAGNKAIAAHYRDDANRLEEWSFRMHRWWSSHCEDRYITTN